MSVFDRMPVGYHLRLGSGLDRARLVQFMQRTYQEMKATDSYAHLAQTVDQYLSCETPLWWVATAFETHSETLPDPGVNRSSQSIACLWLGTAIDQVYGDRYAHIFLLYVLPEHRRRGIGKALMLQAEAWAVERGDRQIGLQVFQSNQAALNLYGNLGFEAQSVWMVKLLR